MGGSGGPSNGTSRGLGGRGTGGSGSGGPPGGEDQCILSFQTTIFGPVPGVADHLSVGEVLTVVLTATPTSQVGVFTSALAQAGSIGGARQLPTLIGCLQNGVNYSADVISVNGSNVGIRVRNA